MREVLYRIQRWKAGEKKYRMLRKDDDDDDGPNVKT